MICHNFLSGDRSDRAIIFISQENFSAITRIEHFILLLIVARNGQFRYSPKSIKYLPFALSREKASQDNQNLRNFNRLLGPRRQEEEGEVRIQLCPTFALIPLHCPHCVSPRLPRCKSDDPQCAHWRREKSATVI